MESLMDRAWPAPETSSIGGWQARFAAGVTRRANSVLPNVEPADVDATIREVERAYAERGLPTVVQMTPAAQPSDLDSRLADHGYRLDAPTHVLIAPAQATSSDPPTCVELTNEPTEAWMDLWWLVDGRGDSAARAVAHTILTGAPARYASIVDDQGVAAVGRVALLDGWAGIYCMAVRPDARRRGHAAAVLCALADAAAGRRLWLQVLADNVAAHGLYRAAGFTRAFTHHYRVRDAM